MKINADLFLGDSRHILKEIPDNLMFKGRLLKIKQCREEP